MFIHSHITEEIATKCNCDAADVIVYIPLDIDGKANINNFVSLSVWIVPCTVASD